MSVAKVTKLKTTWQGEDPVFFHKSQIKLGTVLVCYGRIDHGTRWEVVEIRSFKRKSVRLNDRVEQLNDDIVMRRVGTRATKTMQFGSMSYSATWRIG